MKDSHFSAKEIFLEYGGDYYQMEREGRLEAYRAFGIPQATEKLWAGEYERTLLNHFRAVRVVDSETITLINLIKHFQNYAEFLEFLTSVEQLRESFDSFTALRLCEEITKLCWSLEKEKTSDRYILGRAKSIVSEMLQATQKQPITVHPYYRSVPHLPQVFEEERLRERVNRLAVELKKATNGEDVVPGRSGGGKGRGGLGSGFFSPLAFSI